MLIGILVNLIELIYFVVGLLNYHVGYYGFDIGNPNEEDAWHLGVPRPAGFAVKLRAAGREETAKMRDRLSPRGKFQIDRHKNRP
jgi:hypothetical protein